MLNSTVTDDDAYEHSCEPVQRKEYLFFSVVSGLQILLNGVLIIAVSRGKRILRHNYVYAYVASTLTANVAFATFVLLSLVSDYAGSTSHTGRVDFSNPRDLASMRWWSLRKSISASMFLIMSGNIAALIYGLRESSYFITRFMRRQLTREPVTKNTSLRTRKLRAIIIISIVWLYPCMLALIPPIVGSCLENCLCKPATYDGYPCRENNVTHCSSTWLPVPKYFLGCILGSWTIMILIILYLLINAIIRFIRTVASAANDENGGTRQLLCSRKLPSFNHTIKLLISITGFFIAFTFPSMFIILFDILSLLFHTKPIIISSCYILSIVYGFISPVLMVKYMPALRSAASKMFWRVGRRRSNVRSSVSSSQTGHSYKRRGRSRGEGSIVKDQGKTTESLPLNSKV